MQTTPTSSDRFSEFAAGSVPRASARTQQGFTMTEMLATVAVLVILMSFAAESFNSTMSSNRAYGAQAELLSSIALAKTEALRRGMPVVITATNPVSGNEFGGGWSVWVDSNGNGTLEDGEPVVRVHEALTSNVKVSSSGTTSIRYGTMGFLVPSANLALAVCPARAANAGSGYVVSLAPNGMADVAPSTSC